MPTLAHRPPPVCTMGVLSPSLPATFCRQRCGPPTTTVGEPLRPVQCRACATPTCRCSRRSASPGRRARRRSGGEYAIHGTNRPESIGVASYGCIRMHNEDITDLFGRVEVGTHVVAMR